MMTRRIYEGRMNVLDEQGAREKSSRFWKAYFVVLLASAIIAFATRLISDIKSGGNPKPRTEINKEMK